MERKELFENPLKDAASAVFNVVNFSRKRSHGGVDFQDLLTKT